MDLVSLKLTKKEAKELNGPITVDSDLPKYPYGTRIRLDSETVDRFPELRDTPVGTKLTIQCEAELVEYSEHQTQNGDDHCSVELQITDMGIEEDEATKRERKRGDRLNELGGGSRYPTEE